MGRRSPRRVGRKQAAPAARETRAAPPARAARRFAGWRGWCLRLTLVVVFAALAIAVPEAGLRLAGYGYPTGFFLGPDDRGACWTNGEFGRRFFPRRLVRLPCETLLPAREPGTRRIFLLGSSAAMGMPETRYGVARLLEVMLRQRHPQHRFEVVNAAMTAINSHVALEIARDCAARQPDLFVVYLGNNEVVGPYGPGTVFQRSTPALAVVRASMAVRSLRLGQWLGDLAGGLRPAEEAPESWQGMAMFMKHLVAEDDPRLAAVYANYRRNLADICRVARRADARVVLATLAVNLADCPPFASRHRPGLTDAELARWEALCRDAAAAAAAGRAADAIALYEQAAGIDDRHAELHYRLGRCLVEAGRLPAAREHLARARDLDLLRFRADSRINATVRQVAAEHAGKGVLLADAEAALGTGEADADGELFYEHVHLTFDGNHRLARALVGPVSAALFGPAAGADPGPVPTRPECAAALALTPWDECRMARSMLAVTRAPPFTGQFGHAERQAGARARLRRLQEAAAGRQAVQAALEAYTAALAARPRDPWLHEGCGEFLDGHGQCAPAVGQYEAAVRLNPHSSTARLGLGNALFNAGRTDEAITAFGEAIAIRRDSAEAHTNLGGALAAAGRIDEAVAEYRKALEIRPDHAEAHNNLGAALAGQGRAEEALAEYRAALASRPDFGAARDNVVRALLAAGRSDAAVEEYRRALEIEPDDPAVHSGIGDLLGQLGRLDEAIGHYRLALEARPDLEPARRALAAALAGRGRFDEAAAEFRALLETSPHDAGVHTNLGNALAASGNLDEAIRHFRTAIEIEPGQAEAHNNLGQALAACGLVDEALKHYRRSLELRPAQAEAHNNLAVALARRGLLDEAIDHYRQALQAVPGEEQVQRNLDDALARREQVVAALARRYEALGPAATDAAALTATAWTLATDPNASLRDGKRAVELALRARAVAGDREPTSLAALAAALAEAGRLDEAVETARTALEAARGADQPALSRSIEAQLRCHEAGTPFHEKTSEFAARLAPDR